MYWLCVALFIAFAIGLEVIDAPWWFVVLAFCVTASSAGYGVLYAGSRVMEDIDRTADRLGIAPNDNAGGR